MADFLATYLVPQWRRSAILFALLIATIGLELANPQILKQFIDAAIDGATVDRLITIGLIFLAVALATQLVSVAETYVAEDVGLTITNALRADLTLHTLRLDPDFFSAHPPGELIERIDGDVGILADFFARFVVTILGNALLVLGLLIVLLQIDWRVAATIGLFTALALLAMNLLRGIAVSHWAAARQASADLFGFLEERLLSTEDIRANGGTGYVMRSFFARARNHVR